MSGWYGLLTILQGRAPILPGAECPNDGVRLHTAPDGGLYCPFDGWRGTEAEPATSGSRDGYGYGLSYYGVDHYGF